MFTDRTAGDTAAGGAPLSLAHEPDALHADIERVDLGSSTRLVAVNDCLCVVTLRAWIEQSDLAQIPAGISYQATLQPGASRTLVEAQRADGAKGQLQFSWRRALGAPDAVHTPSRPYRAPFALGATFLVSQAYPTRVTHVTPDSLYAVDIALPDGTPVYAARAGTVINVRHDSFSGAPLPALLDQANVVEILHEDGTIAVYAHLHWDSIRVRIGQRVQLGRVPRQLRQHRLHDRAASALRRVAQQRLSRRLGAGAVRRPRRGGRDAGHRAAADRLLSSCALLPAPGLLGHDDPGTIGAAEAE